MIDILMMSSCTAQIFNQSNSLCKGTNQLFPIDDDVIASSLPFTILSFMNFHVFVGY